MGRRTFSAVFEFWAYCSHRNDFKRVSEPSILQTNTEIVRQQRRRGPTKLTAPFETRKGTIVKSKDSALRRRKEHGGCRTKEARGSLAPERILASTSESASRLVAITCWNGFSRPAGQQAAGETDSESKSLQRRLRGRIRSEQELRAWCKLRLRWLISIRRQLCLNQ